MKQHVWATMRSGQSVMVDLTSVNTGEGQRFPNIGRTMPEWGGVGKRQSAAEQG